MYRNHRWNIVLLFLAAIFLITGCSKDIKITTGLAKDEMFKIAGETQDIGGMMLILINEKNQYEGSLGTDVWTRNFDDVNLETELKEKVKKQMVELNVIYHMATEDDIAFSDEEKEKLQNAATEYYESISAEEKEQMSITQSSVYELYEKMYLSDKYYEKKSTEKQKEISDEDAKVISVMYIYFKMGEPDIYGTVQPYDEETLAGIRGRAQEALDAVTAGADFQSIAEQYSDDAEYRLTFGRGNTEANFEEAAFSLSSGENSGIVETESGLYIIKCVSDYLEKETEENKNTLKENYQAEYFREIYEPYLEKQTLEFNTKAWEKVNLSDYTACGSSNIYTVYEKYMEE